MRTRKTLLGLIVVLAILSVPVIAAESVDKVILASSTNNPDAMVANSVSYKLGVPILLADSDELSEETQSALEDLGPEEVVVVGGPEVVSEEVVQEVENLGYNTTWLWGMSRYGTAEEITDKFWPEGSEEVILVENSIGEEDLEVLASSSNLAGERPVLPVAEGSIPSGILDQLNEMDVEEVTVVGTNITDEMESDLSELGIEIDEVIQEDEEDELQERLRERSMEDLRSNSTLMVVASSASNQAVSAVNVPGSQRLMVSSEEDISDIVGVVNNRSIQEVKVVGMPSLAQVVADTLENETDSEVELVVGQAAAAQAANVAKDNKVKFSEKFQKRNQEWKEEIQRNQDRIKKKANQTIRRANRLMGEYNISSEELEEARESYREGDYTEAFEESREIRQEIREERWEDVRDNMTALRREVNEEVRSLRQKTQELSMINQEFGQAMRENMTMEERLETVEDFRERRQEKVEEIIEQARQMGPGEGEWDDRIERSGDEVEDSAECVSQVSEAKKSSSGQMCTQQTQILECPESDYTYEAKDGCEISYLKDQGWEVEDEEDSEENETEEDNETEDGENETENL